MTLTAPVAAAGDHLAVELYPDTGLGTHQLDRSGIHAAQGRGVDGQLWGIVRIGGTRCGLQRLGVDVIGPRDDRQLVRVDLCVDGRRTGDDFELVNVVGVQACSIDGHAALIDLITRNLPIGDHRLAGSQCRLRRVDEAAAVAGDAIGVGDDHMGRLPRHFGVAAQLARAAAVDLVEDGGRSASIEIAVAQDDPTQLSRLGTASDVVEDQPVAANVVVLELVVRQAAGIGGGNVDDGYAVARLAERRARCADHDAIRLRP